LNNESPQAPLLSPETAAPVTVYARCFPAVIEPAPLLFLRCYSTTTALRDRLKYDCNLALFASIQGGKKIIAGNSAAVRPLCPMNPAFDQSSSRGNSSLFVGAV
jgi:hypothetical protein